MRALVIGYGSIGARHARLLVERGIEVACVTANKDCPYPQHDTIAAALALRAPDLVVIANSTARHAATLCELAAADYAGRLLVEKPLAGTAAALPTRLPVGTRVAFNLRFHPLVGALRTAVAGRRLITASFYAGMYLPDWRPNVDYRQGYSARRAQGGGVLRDLTHELDLALWIAGPWRRVAAIGGKFSELEIDSDDAFSLLMATDLCPALSIHVNYLDRMPRRSIVINADGVTAVADLIAGRLIVNGSVQDAAVERDETYRAQLDAVLGDVDGVACTLAEAAAVDSLVEAAQRAATEGVWVVAPSAPN